MAGFREFLTGEVLSAANVNNFLMKQSVMVFADAAARTAALGAEVAEGMLTYNEDTAQLEVFDGAAFVPAGAEPPAGIGSNVVSTTKVDTQVSSVTSVAEVDVTGLTATITPTSATSKILVVAFVALSCDGIHGAGLLLQRGGVTIGAGTTRGNKLGISGSAFPFIDADRSGGAVAMFVDSPATTSATTYSVRLRNLRVASQTLFVNRAAFEIADRADFPSASSTLTVIEVAA